MELHELAIDSLVTIHDLKRCGLDPYAIRKLCRAGAIRRVCRGWHAVADPSADRPPWEGADKYETARHMHTLAAQALVTSFEGRAAASHQSAVILHRGRLWQSSLAVVHLERTGDDHSRHRRGAVIHPRTAPNIQPVTKGFERPLGYLSTPPAIAAVQVGLRPHAPGAAPQPLESLVAAEGFLFDGLITSSDLREAIRPPRGGARHTRRAPGP